MRKALRSSILFALVAMLAVFGCTTNRTRAEGEPYIGGPSVGPSSPTSNSGGTSVPTTPQPMTSSYRGSEQSEFTAPRPHRLTPDEAAMIMADHLPKVRVLGPADPGTAVRPYVSAGIVTGQVNIGGPTPVTANTTLNSPATPSITSGADFSGVSAAPTVTANLATVTPTTAALAVTPGTFAAGSTATVTGTTSTNATPTTASSTLTPTTTALNANVTANGNVQVVSSNGKLTVTNMSSRRQ